MHFEKLKMLTGNYASCTVVLACARCSKSLSLKEEHKQGKSIYADLNGKPFEAYYCEECYQKILKGEKS